MTPRLRFSILVYVCWLFFLYFNVHVKNSLGKSKFGRRHYLPLCACKSVLLVVTQCEWNLLFVKYRFRKWRIKQFPVKLRLQQNHIFKIRLLKSLFSKQIKINILINNFFINLVFFLVIKALFFPDECYWLVPKSFSLVTKFDCTISH